MSKLNRFFSSICDLLVFLPSIHTSTVMSGRSSPLAFKYSAKASMHERGVAGAVPVGGVPAVVEQVLHQPRGLLILGVGQRQQLQVVGVGLGLAAVPVPPVIFGGQPQIGGLVLVVLDHVLLDVLEDDLELLLHGRDVGRLRAVARLAEEGQAEHRLGIDRDVGAVAEQEVRMSALMSPLSTSTM